MTNKKEKRRYPSPLTTVEKLHFLDFIARRYLDGRLTVQTFIRLEKKYDFDYGPGIRELANRKTLLGRLKMGMRELLSSRISVRK